MGDFRQAREGKKAIQINKNIEEIKLVKAHMNYKVKKSKSNDKLYKLHERSID